MNRQTHTSTETTTTPHSDETWRQSTWSHDNSGNEWSVGQLVDYSMVHGQLTKVTIDDIKHNFTPGAMDNPHRPMSTTPVLNEQIWNIPLW